MSNDTLDVITVLQRPAALMGAANCAACEYRTSAAVGLSVMTEPDDVETCIRPEVEALRADGIATVCSCCGHGDPLDAYIVVDAADRQKMIDRGYTEREPHNGSCSGCGAFFRAKLPEDLSEVNA